MLPSEKKIEGAFKEECPKREQKKYVNIQWNSALFFQIGLILALLITFWVIESDWKLSPKTVSRNEKRTVVEKVDTKQYRLEPEIVIRNHSQPNEPIRRIQAITPVSTFTPIDNSSLLTEPTIPSSQVDLNMPVDPPMILPGTTEPNRKVSLFGVQKVPVFPGCESLKTNEERKECFQAKIQQFIARKFDVDKFSEKYAGQKKKISVQFTINTFGEIDELKAVSPEKDLSEEAIRVISGLPKMTPGQNNNLPVEVVYTVPISLNINY
jgi:periplasmic protein TonB